MAIHFPLQDKHQVFALQPQPSPCTHTFIYTGSVENRVTIEHLGSESILLPASQASFCMVLGHGKYFAVPLRAGKGDAREGFKNNSLPSPMLMISFCLLKKV